MSYNILEKVFGSAARVKMMKFFLFNPEQVFSKEDIVSKCKVTSAIAQKEIKMLVDIKMVKKRVMVVAKRSKSGKITKKKTSGYILNSEFELLKNMSSLLINNEPLQHGDISRRLSKTGKIKLIIVSGIFIQDDDSRVDILVVGDEMKDRAFRNTIKTMESEIGKELRFVCLNTQDFIYRKNICDRLMRDIFDYDHEVVVDRIGLEY